MKKTRIPISCLRVLGVADMLIASFDIVNA